MIRRSVLPQKPLFLLLSLLCIFAVLFWIFAINHRFYFADDREAQYFPYGLIIRDSLLKGEFPFLTTRTFYGGALWIDWQYGLLNPVALLMNFLITPQHLELSGFLFALVSCVLLAGGTYSLARAYEFPPAWSALFALLMAVNVDILYYDARDWHPGITSLAWFAFTWAALRRLLAAERDVMWHVVIAALLMYMMVSAGWPHTDIAFALLGCALLAAELIKKDGRAARLVQAGVLGFLLCLPVIVPVLAAFPWTGRDVIPKTAFLTPSLLDLLNFSTPIWEPLMISGDPNEHSAVPLFFVAWFAAPCLFLIDWTKKNPRDVLLPALLAGIFFLFGVLGFGPKIMLRYPFRWAPYMDLFGLIALFQFVRQEAAFSFSFRKIALAFASLLLPSVAAFANGREISTVTVMDAALPIAFLGIFITCQKRRRLQDLPGFWAATSLVLFLLVYFAWPTDVNTLEWGKRDVTPATSPGDARAVNYLLTTTTQPTIPPELRNEREYLTAALGAYYNVNTFNGYSSMGQKGFTRLMDCQNFSFIICTFQPGRLFRKEPETQAAYLDLFKIDRIVVDKGLVAQSVARKLPGWKATPQQTTVLFTGKRNELPGTLSWHSPQLRVSDPATPGDNTESFQVKNGNAPALLVFARLFYPGFHATLDNAPVTVRPVNDMLVGVEVPAQGTGTLRLCFLPPYLVPCVLIALLALGAGIALAWREHARGI